MKSEKLNASNADTTTPLRIRMKARCPERIRVTSIIEVNEKWKKKSKCEVKTYLICPISFILVCALWVTEKDVIAIFLKLMGIL